MSPLPFVLMLCMSCIFCDVFSWFLLPHPHPFPSRLPKKLAGFSSGDPHRNWSPRNISKNPYLPFFPPVATSPPVSLTHRTLTCSPWPTSWLFWDLKPCEVISFSDFFGVHLPQPWCFLPLLLTTSQPTLHSWPNDCWGPGSSSLRLLLHFSAWPGRNGFFSPYFFLLRTWQLWYRRLLPLLLLSDQAFSYETANKSKLNPALAHSWTQICLGFSTKAQKPFWCPQQAAIWHHILNVTGRLQYALRDALLISPPLPLSFLFLPIITAGARQNLHCIRPPRTTGGKCRKNSPRLTRQNRWDFFLQFNSNSGSFCQFYAELKKMVSDILRKTGSHFKTWEGKKILL